MSRPVFHSGFADEINLYLDYKIASGYTEKSWLFIRMCGIENRLNAT